MIAIFTVLGLLLFGGGAYAIYDGWPYLVLERGFTEVIIGSIASSAGLIMLSLAWVLKDVRATRRALLEAIALRPEGALPVTAAEPAAVAVSRAEGAAASRSVAPAAIGAIAGVAATSAVTQALAAPEAEPVSAPVEGPPASGDRDLFGALVTQHLQEPEPDAESEPEPVSEVAQTSSEEAEPLPDMFEEALSTAALQPEEASAEFEAEGHEPAELVAAKVQPADTDESGIRLDEEPASVADRPFDDRPVDHVDATEAPAAAEDRSGLDEFSALRASLAGHLNEPEKETGRIEPSFSPERDPFASAEAWMDRASSRREPWLGAPPDEEAAPAEEAAPLWPPRTEAQTFDAPAEPAGVDAEAETAVDPVEAPADEEAVTIELEEAASAATAEPQAEETPAVSDAPAASDEGIVGAYQVGDAHFTIYADGSIRARTPDGEYSFASMDELKVYLASEKSRLGV